jgi:hypothetical protein
MRAALKRALAVVIGKIHGKNYRWDRPDRETKREVNL